MKKQPAPRVHSHIVDVLRDTRSVAQAT